MESVADVGWCRLALRSATGTRSKMAFLGTFPYLFNKILFKIGWAPWIGFAKAALIMRHDCLGQKATQPNSLLMALQFLASWASSLYSTAGEGQPELACFILHLFVSPQPCWSRNNKGGQLFGFLSQNLRIWPRLWCIVALKGLLTFSSTPTNIQPLKNRYIYF